MKGILSLMLLVQLVVYYSILIHLGSAAKVVELGAKLPELIKLNPDRSWLIKFYAPWCHYCKQLEPTFNVVAEKLYQKYDNLVVGKVDCTSNRGVCSEYGVESFPTITFINQKTKLKYNHERETEAMVSFVDRLMAPDINYLRQCSDLHYLRDKHGIIIVGNDLKPTGDLYRHLESIIPEHKSTWWFYFLRKSCKDLIQEPGVFILKAGSNRANKFDEELGTSKETLVEWIERNSFPIFSRLTWANYEKYFKTGKLIAVAYLDEYKPHRKLSALSKKYSQQLGEFARSYSNKHDDNVMFAWSADFELVSMLTLTSLKPPNVVLLRPDQSYYIAQQEELELSDTDALPANLTVKSIETLIYYAKRDELQFSGGNSLLHEIYRSVYRNVMRVKLMYTSQPLLFTVLIVPPILIILFVVYSTCYDSKEESEKEVSEFLSTDEDDDDSADEELPLKKQPVKRGGKKLKKS